MKIPWLLLITMVCFLASPLVAQTAVKPTQPPGAAPVPGTVVGDSVVRAPETPEQHDARMAWWREAKFGMFIHWGLYCIPADGEWHMRAHQESFADYSKLAKQFNPTKFNADEWAAIAQDAGMKYMVLTTKHHDGFAMFHSKASPYNIYDATPFHRDPLKELSIACPKHDIKLGTYYSVIADWGHPGGGAGCPKWDHAAQDGDLDDYVNNVSIPQVKELLTNYGPIAVLWFDSDGSNVGSAERAARYEPILALQPNIIVDPRLQHYPGDFQTCEGKVPVIPPKGDWELCDRVNGSWGFTHSPAHPLKVLLTELTDAWGKGGNVLLNVGPDETGVIPKDSVDVLHQIGDWMRVNGEAVYGSQRGPFDYLPWGSASRKGDHLYLFVLNWPADGILNVPISNPIKDAHLMTDPKKSLTCTLDSKTGLTSIYVPKIAPDSACTVISIEPQGTVTPFVSLLRDVPLVASEKQQDAQGITSESGGNWRLTSSSASLQADMGKPKTFSTLRFSAPYTKIAKMVFEVKDGDKWKTFYSADNPKGTDWTVSFPPATGQIVRVTLTASQPGIRVSDWELFPPFYDATRI